MVVDFLYRGELHGGAEVAERGFDRVAGLAGGVHLCAHVLLLFLHVEGVGDNT